MLEDINTDYQDGMPEIHIVPDRDMAAQLGTTVNSMGTEVSQLVGGQLFTADTQYPKDGHRYNIRIRSEEDQHQNPEDVDKVLLSEIQSHCRGLSLKISDHGWDDI